MAREIFISYSRDDKELVHPFAEYISRAVGRDCWIDLEGIESGEEFEEVIIEAIDECQVVLFMLSDSSLRSAWTKREVYYAEDVGKRIVPVLINGEKLRGWFQFHFGNVDFIKLQSKEQKEKLVRNLRSWLGVERQRSEEKRITDKAEDVKRRTEEEAKRRTKDESNRIKAEKERQRAEDAKLKPVHGRRKRLGIEYGDELYGFADALGKVVIPYQWKDARAFSEGLAAVQDANAYQGYIDMTGKLVIPCQWVSVRPFSEGLAAVRNAHFKWGFIDKTGK